MPTDKERTGSQTCSTAELPRRLEPEAGLEPATTRGTGDNPILRPVERAVRMAGQGYADGAYFGRIRTCCFPASRAFYRLNYDNHLRSAQRKQRRARGELGRQPVARSYRVRTCSPTQGLLPITQALRPVGKSRWTSGAADTGLRKRDSNPQHQTRIRRLSHGEQPPLRFGAITCELRPIEIGVTNRIRTGTNAFTGRDAAVTS